MPVFFLVLGMAGVALALFGFFGSVYPSVTLGVALIFAVFFLFVRTNQSTPAPAKGDDSQSPH